MIPSVEECFKFMEAYGMLDHIRAHSVIVEKVASLIARGLKDAGKEITLEKVTAGALMHDIGKTPCLESGDDHEAKGREICLDNALEEIAEIVGQHVWLRGFSGDDAIHEKEIVYYADKRVNHDRVVSLEERFEYLFVRYAKDRPGVRQWLQANYDLCRAVEKKLFSKLDFAPEALSPMVG